MNDKLIKALFTDGISMPSDMPVARFTRRLSSLAKKHLDANLRKLYEAKMVNEQFELTDKGRDALETILVEANLAELVKEAEKVLGENK